MSKKNIGDKFSIDMDAYFNGIETVDGHQSEEYNEILNLGKTLSNKDFSKNSNKEAVLAKALKNINEHKGDSIMKNSNKIKRVAASVASCALICGALTQTSFAKDLAQRVITTISVGNGNIKLEQVKAPSTSENKTYHPIRNGLEGKIFDKDGKPVAKLAENTQYYTADGEKICGFAIDGEGENAPIEIVTEKSMKEHRLVVKDSSKLNEYTCFNVKLPSYLPEGYKFDRAELIKGKDGKVSNEYVTVFFTNEKNGKKIYMHQRISSDKTKYVSSLDGKVEKTKVNGEDAAICADGYIDWQSENVLYEVGSKELTNAELTKVAESVK